MSASGRPRPPLKYRAAVAAQTALGRAGFELRREGFRHNFVHQLDHHGVTAVLDVGANTGQFGAALRRGGFAGTIVSVEPLQAAHDELRERAAADPGWTTERAGVAARPGSLTVNVAGNSTSSSVLPMLDRHLAAAPSSAYVATEQVEAVTVDDLVTRHGLDPATTLLKVDVQGYEKAVLDGAAATLPRIAGVRTELSLTPLYEGQVLLPEMVAHLAAYGLELWLVEPGFVEPGTRRLLQLDGVFYRT